MNTHALAIGRRLTSRVLAIRRRTWIILGVALLVVTALATWAAIALVLWAVERAPGALESVGPFVGLAIDQLDAVFPGLRELVAEHLPAVADPVNSGDAPGAS